MQKLTYVIFILALSTVLLLAGCNTSQPAPTARLNVVTTTSILADVVKQVGGDYISVNTIVPLGADEHEYQPAPQAIARVSEADIVFKVGLGLEPFLDQIITNAGGSAQVVTVSDGITARSFTDLANPVQETGSSDPHVWFDPANVEVWVNNIQAALVTHDPAHRSDYETNAGKYIESLKELDSWIAEQTQLIPLTSRKIVTDHMLFGYFAEKYGFKVIGAIIPSYSSSAQPSAKELAALEDAIKQYGVKAIFIGNTINPTLAQRVAQDTGINLVTFYTGSLSDKNQPASTYLD